MVQLLETYCKINAVRSFHSACALVAFCSKNPGGSKFHRLEKNVGGSVRVYRHVHIYFRKYYARFEKNSQILRYPPTLRVTWSEKSVPTTLI